MLIIYCNRLFWKWSISIGLLLSVMHMLMWIALMAEERFAGSPISVLLACGRDQAAWRKESICDNPSRTVGTLWFPLSILCDILRPTRLFLNFFLNALPWACLFFLPAVTVLRAFQGFSKFRFWDRNLKYLTVTISISAFHVETGNLLPLGLSEGDLQSWHLCLSLEWPKESNFHW